MQLCQGLVGRAVRPTDTPDERWRKELTVPILVVVTVLTIVAAIMGNVDSTPALITWAFQACFWAGSLGGLAWILITRSLSLRVVGTLGLILTVGLVLCDWSAISTNAVFRPWAFVVLIMDLFLATNVPLAHQVSALTITILWLLLASVEQAFILGINYLGEWNDRPEEAMINCDCARPPCAFGIRPLILNFPSMISILVIDFYATRNFAEGLRSKQAKIVSSVRLSERVAQLLAAYATDDARRVVAEEGSSLPEALCASYEQLLDNLDSYRVFLPDSLLFAAKHQQQQQQQEDCEDGTTGSPRQMRPVPRNAPGLGEGTAEVAVCFTDIQSSTELWEAHPQGMYEGLNIHNDLMRSAYAACNGYEVKTIGDSFMLAFDGGQDAVRFGLEAQLGLLRQRWPEDLLCHPLCANVAVDGKPLWGGLRVRIGVQSGPVRVERNPVTGRCDYFGHTVNTAARLEAVLRKGGLVAASDAVVQAISVDGMSALGSPVIHDAGLRELKGVKNKIQVWVLIPQSLRERINVLYDTEAATAPITPGEESGSEPSLQGAPSGGLRAKSATSLSGSEGPTCVRLTTRLALRLEQSVGTCAVARAPLRHIEPIAERLPVFASAAARAADQTQGVVDSLLSACVTVTWNASRPCADHTAACRRFIAVSFRAPCHLGATSGGMLSGSVSTGRRSFATAIGGCIELAAALAEEAERCVDRALVTGAVGADCAAAGIAFSAQLWQPDGDPVLTVLAVQLPAGDDETWDYDAGQRDEAAAAFGSAITALFFRACAALAGSPEQMAVLHELQADGGGEPSEAARQLAERIARGVVRSRPMPRLWEPGEGGRRGTAWGRQAPSS